MGKILLKRGQSDKMPSLTLEAGEPAFVLDTGKLYVGDGTNKVLINPDIETVESANKLTAAKTISLSGDATGSTTFDGSADKAIAVTLKNTGTAGVQKPKVTTDAQGRVISSADLAATDIPTLTMSKISDAGTAAKANTGTASGNVPVLDASGKLNASVLPAIAITDTFVTANQAAMLALTAEVGDVAVRTDLNKSFILKTAGAGTLANWQELLTPASPVQSVNGQTGVVTITDITGNAGTADALKNGRTITVNGDGSGSTTFNGSANVTLGLTLANSGVTAGSYAKVTVDAKGRVTAGAALAATDIPSLDWSKITTGKPTTISGYGITDGLTASSTIDGGTF